MLMEQVLLWHHPDMNHWTLLNILCHMNRRNFLRKISLVGTVAVVAPLVITKVVTTGIIERETISSVERSVVQSSWLAKQDLEFHLNWENTKRQYIKYYKVI